MANKKKGDRRRLDRESPSEAAQIDAARAAIGTTSDDVLSVILEEMSRGSQLVYSGGVYVRDKRYRGLRPGSEE